ncbi:metaxin-2-like [Sycon ciliatum]|uniref:metaxin-2-like n=1 Tax=Sycon ciliatum TaxID=27933 RepID=UPI0031F703BD
MTSLGINDHLSFMMQNREGKTAWDSSACLYVPPAGSSVLPTRARCLAIKALLELCNLPYQCKELANAEFMSHSGQIPVLVEGKTTSCGFDEIVAHFHFHELLPSSDLPAPAKLDIKAFSALVHGKLFAAEVFSAWCVPGNAKVSCCTYGNSLPFPLNFVLTWRKKKRAQDLCIAVFSSCRPEQVYGDAAEVCRTLSLRLGSAEFYGDVRPTELDALVCSHLQCILDMDESLPDRTLVDCVKKHGNLVEYCARMAQRCLIAQGQDNGSTAQHESHS